MFSLQRALLLFAPTGIITEAEKIGEGRVVSYPCQEALYFTLLEDYSSTISKPK